jgi:3-dehydro-L-gulonate 2-dehydrogenase
MKATKCAVCQFEFIYNALQPFSQRKNRYFRIMMNTETQPETVMIPHETMRRTLQDILTNRSMPAYKARICADVFTKNSIDGVYSHGINRFPRFVHLLDKGFVKANRDAVCTTRVGALEQWDGGSGIGITNALSCTDRAIELASFQGIGCIALSNTNHWMRAGTYAQHAATKGFAFIGWSNTIRNTPAWGAIDARLGNNPLTIGVPFDDSPIVLDMAMSQFSYGALERYAMRGDRLPVAGGFDEDGNASTDAPAILKSRRTLPIGYWKGSGLSLLLDILATILSGGLAVSQISKQQDETNLSQVFIAFNLKSMANYTTMNRVIHEIIRDLKESKSINESEPVRYPGESVALTRKKNLANGIPVNINVWKQIQELEAR